MEPSTPVVVDTNIIFSALLRADSRFTEILLYDHRDFHLPESVVVELFRHKERIVGLSKLDESDVILALHQLLRRISVEREDLIPVEHRRAAVELCRGVDPSDAPQVALTLALDGVLWTGDRRLRTALEGRGFTRFFDPAAR